MRNDEIFREFCAINAKGETVALADSTDVKPNSDVVVKFNTEVDAATVTENNFMLETKAGVAVAVQRTLSDDKMTVTIDPVNLLEVKEDYVLTVNKDVKAAEGESTLTESMTVNFKVADATIQTAFKAGTSGSSFGSALNVEGSFKKDAAEKLFVGYNKALDANTVNTTNVKLYNVTDSKFVQVTVAYDKTTKSISLVPEASEIVGNKEYEVRVSGVKGLDGADAEDFVGQIAIGTALNFLKESGNITVTEDSEGDVYPGLEAKSFWRGNIAGGTTVITTPFKLHVRTPGTILDETTLDSVKVMEFDEKEDEVKADTEVAGTWTYSAETYWIGIGLFVKKQLVKDRILAK